jgi:hypothetical protein
MISLASSGLAAIQSRVAYQASTSFWTSSGRYSTTARSSTRKSGIEPAKSAESNSTLLPSRPQGREGEGGEHAGGVDLAAGEPKAAGVTIEFPWKYGGLAAD